MLVVDDKDAEYEERHTFQITQLYAEEGDPKANGNKLQTTVIVSQSDYPYGRFFLATADLKRSKTIDEDCGEITFAVLRVGGTSRNVPVLYKVEGLAPGSSTKFNAADSADFSPETGNITVADGSTRGEFSISIVPDNIPEFAEKLVVSLLPTEEQTGHADIVTTQSLTRVTIEIEENDDVHGLVGFASDDLSVTMFEPNEADGLAHNHTFTVVRRRGRIGETKVKWALSDTHGQVSPSSGELVFPDDTDGDGEQKMQFTIIAADDNVPEIAEDFSIALSIEDGPAALDEGAEKAVLTLAGSDHPHGVFSIDPLPSNGTYAEPANDTDAVTNGVTCTITRSGGLLGTVHVLVRTKNSSTSSSAAESDVDFAVLDETVEFLENETHKTVQLFVHADAVPEEMEVGHLEIVSASLNPITGAPTATESPHVDGDEGTKSFYIAANDYPNGVVHFPNRFVSDGLLMDEETGIASTGGCEAGAPGKAGHIVLCRAGGSFDTVVVDWEVEHVTTLKHDIHSGQQKGSVTFGPNEVEKFIKISPVADKIPEVEETFQLKITSSNDTELFALGTASVDGVNGVVSVGGTDDVTVTIPLNEDPHGIIRFSEQSLDGDKTTAAEGAAVVFTLVRSTEDDEGVLNGGTVGTIKVDFKLVPVDDAGTGDLSIVGTEDATLGSVFMLENETEADFRILIEDDTLPEPQEAYKIQVVGAALVSSVQTDVEVLAGKEEAVLTILASDDYFGVFSFDKSDATAVDEPGGGDDDDVGEASGTKNVVRLTVVRKGGANGSVTVPYKTVGFTEQDIVRDVQPQKLGEDATGPVLFTLFKAPELGMKVVGKPFKSFTVTGGLQECLLSCLSTDGCHTSEYFLHPTTRSCRLFKKSGVSRYTDADSYAVYEVRSNRDELVNRRLAVARDDYLEVSDGEITFLDGERAVDIIIRIEADEEPELVESFGVQLGTPQPKGASRFPFVDSPRIDTAKSDARIDILPNDSPFGIVEFTADSTQNVVEGKSATLTANRTKGAFGTITVEWYTNLDADKDLSGNRKGNFTFEDGVRTASISFNAEDDARPELDQPIKFILKGDAASDDSRSEAVVTIEGNDLANGRFGFSSESISRVVAEPANGATAVRLIVLRSHSKLQKTAVDWEVKMKSGAKANASDISPLSGTINFADGRGHGLIDLKVAADTVPERLEEYVVQLTKATGESNLADILSGLDKSTISAYANDDVHGVFSFQDSAELVLEEGKLGTVTVVRSRGTHGQVKIPFRLAEGTTAIPELDFKIDTCNSDNSSELIFKDGQTSCEIQIDVVQETTPEEAEPILIVMLTPEVVSGDQEDKQAPRLAADDTNKTITIARNDYASGSFVFADAATKRLAEDSGNHTITVKRLAGAFGSAEVKVVTSAGADGEVEISKDILLFADGEREINFTMSVIDDTAPEADESFSLELAPVAPVVSNPDDQEEGKRSFVLKANDDFRGLIHFSEDDAANRSDVEEAAKELSFPVFRSRGTFGAVSVDWKITDADGNAVTAGVDFNVTEGTVKFDAWDNLTMLVLNIVDDATPEIDEDYTLTLHTPAGGCNLISQLSSAPLRIVKNDFYSGSFSVEKADSEVEEDVGSMQITIGREVATGYKGTSMVQWTVIDGEGTSYVPHERFSPWPHITPVQTVPGAVLQWSSSSDVAGPLLALQESGPSTVYAVSSLGNRLVPLATLPTDAAVSVASFKNTKTTDYFAVAESNSSSAIYAYNRDTGAVSAESVPIAASSAVASTITPDGDVFVLFASADSSAKSVLCKRAAGSATFSFSKFSMKGVTGMTTLPLTSKDEERYRWLIAVAAPDGKSRIMRLGLSNDGLASTGDAYTNVVAFHVVKSGAEGKVRLLIVKNDAEVLHAYLEDGRIVGADGASPEQVFADDGSIAGKVSLFPSPGESDATYVLLSGAESEGIVTDPRMYIVTNSGFKPVEAAVTEASETASQQFFAYSPREGQISLMSSGAGVAAMEYTVTLTDAKTDIAPGSGWLVFKDDEKTQDIFLSIVDDNIPERDESFQVLLNASNGESNRIVDPDSTAVVILANDQFQGVVGFHEDSISATPHIEHHTNVSKVTLMLYRARGLDGPVHVPWHLKGGDDALVDLQDANGKGNGVVTFLANESEATLELFVQTDTEPELAEVFEVILSNPEQGTTAELDVNRKTAFVTILGNDDVHGRFQFASVSSKAVEGQNAKVQLVRTAGFEGIVDVYFETIPGTADADNDFKMVQSKVRFGHNVKQVVVTVQTLQDDDPEVDETFGLEIENATLINATSFLVLNSSLTVAQNMSQTEVIIQANDDAFGLFGFDKTSIIVEEPVQGEKKINLEVVRTKGLFGSVTVPWSVRASRSVAAADLTKDILIDETSGVLLFKANESSQKIVFSVAPDSEPEEQEGCVFELGTPELLQPNASTVLDSALPAIASKKGSAQVKIPENDDAQGVFQFFFPDDFDGNVEEGDEITLHVNRTAGAFGASTVKFDVTGDESSGWSNEDVSLSADGVKFGDGDSDSKTLTITIRNDKVPEGIEGFKVTMSIADGSGARVNDGQAEASFAIGASDNGNGIFSFSKESRQVIYEENEDGPTTFTLDVERTVATFGSVTLSWKVDTTTLCATGSRNCDGKFGFDDFQKGQKLKGTLAFESGDDMKQIKLVAGADSKPEGNEHFLVTISFRNDNVIGSIDGSTSQITVAFNDDGRGLIGFRTNALNNVVDEGKELLIPVTRTLAHFGDLAATWVIVNAITGTVADKEFVDASGTLDFKAGEAGRSKIIGLKAISDAKPEIPEHYNLTITSVSGGGRIRDGAGQAQIQIRGNDNPYGTIKIVPKVSLLHGAPPFNDQRSFQFKLSRSGGANGALNVSFRLDHQSEFSQINANNKKALLSFDNLPPARFEANAKSLTQTVEVPDDMLLAAGDHITVTVTDVTVDGVINGQLTEPSPTIQEENDVAILRIDEKVSDNVFGFVAQTRTMLTESGYHQITISRRSTRGSASCDVVVETQAGGPSKDATVSVSRITMPEGQKSTSFRLTPEKNDGAELDENVVVRLANVVVDGSLYVELDNGLRQVYTIAANEDPHGVISFSSVSKDTANLPVPERAAIVSLQLTRQGGAFGHVDVAFTVTGASGAVEAAEGTDGGDYAVLHNKNDDGHFVVTFDEGERTTSVQIQILDDAEPELKEQIVLELVSAVLDDENLPRVPPSIASPSSLTLTIDESDFPYGQLAFKETAIAAEEDVGDAVLVVERRGGTVGRVTVTMSTDPSDGVMSGDAVDFTKFGETVIFEDGEGGPKEIKIGIVDDKFPEQDESFLVELADPTNRAVLAPREDLATVTINANDDPNGVFEFESQFWYVEESEGELFLTINRVAGTFDQVSVNWEAIPRPGSGFTVDDLVGHEGTITLAEGQSSEQIRLQIVNNDADEIEETFDVVLTSPTNGARVNEDTTKSTATVSIDAHGTPHGVFSFDCASIYGGQNADGKSSQEVSMVVQRSDTVGEVSVTIFTYGQASSATANVHYTPISGQTLVYADGEATKEVILKTESLQGGNSSKIVSLGLKDAKGGASIDLKRSQAQVTIYATQFTKNLIDSLQTSLCNSNEVFESQASKSARKYTQAEYDQIVFGIVDLLTQGASELANIRAANGKSRLRRSSAFLDTIFGKTKDLLGDLLDSNHIETEGSGRVQNFRSIGNLLNQFGELQVASRTNPMANTYCPSRSPAVRTPNTLLSISTANSSDIASGILTPIDSPGVVDAGNDLLKIGASHTIELPTMEQQPCASLIHADFRDAVWFPTNDFEPNNIIKEGSTMLVMRSKVLSASLAGGLSWTGPLKYAIPYGEGNGEDYEQSSECVWWDPDAFSSGAWSADGCRQVSFLEGDQAEDMLLVQDANGANQKSITCTCSNQTATYFAILVPSVPLVPAEQMASMYSIATFVKAAIVMFVLIQVWQEGNTPHLRLVLHFIVAVFCAAALNSVSSLISTNLGTSGCTGVGLLLHYFILGQFTWVLAICIHVYWGGLRRLSTFESATPYAGMFRRIMVCGWALPAIIMVIVALLNLGTGGERLYGHSTDDLRMCLVPANQGTFIFGTVGALIVISLLVILFLASKAKRLSAKAKPWLKHTDLFEVDGVKRANGYELRALAIVFLFLVLDVATGLASSYVTTVGSWAIVHLITSLLLGLVLLYYYGAYGSLRHLFETEAHALPSKDLRLETFDEPTDEYLDINGTNETSMMESPARNLVDLSMVSAGFHVSPQPLDQPASPRGGASANAGGAGAGARSSVPAWSPMADRETASDVIAAVHRLSETKGQVTDDPIAEEEFDDLVYALKADTFVGGEDSQSLSGISQDLDPQSKSFAMNRISIADTHL